MGLYIQLIPTGHPNGISLKSGICIMNNDGEFHHMASVHFILEPGIFAQHRSHRIVCCSTISEVQGLRMHLMLRWHFSTPSGWRTRTVSDLYVPRCWMVRSKVIYGIVPEVISMHHKHVDPACASHLANSDLVSQLGLYNIIYPIQKKRKPTLC